MHQLTGCLPLLLVCVAEAASGQPLPDPDLLHAWPAWLVGDHAKARSHFLAAARRGHPLGQYNLAMMLIHGEGGPPSPDEGCVLLQKAAVRVELARAALEQCGAATQSMQEATDSP